MMGISCGLALLGMALQPTSGFLVLVGLYNQSTDSTLGTLSVQSFALNEDLSTITPRFKLAAGKQVSWIAPHPFKSDIFYCMSEIDEGEITTIRVNRDLDSGEMTVVNRVASGGRNPVHGTVDVTGKWLNVANYGNWADENSGSIATFPIEDDGALGEVDSVIQTGIATHAVYHEREPAEGLLTLVLSKDLILQHELNLETGEVTPNKFGQGMSVPNGYGPRHLAFHPTENFALVAEEGGGADTSRVTICRVDPATGVLNSISSLNTLPPGHTEAEGKDMYPGEVLISADGEYAYVSNRDNGPGLKKRDSISVFDVGMEGPIVTLTWKANIACGWYPRSMSLSPSGNMLVVGVQKGEAIQFFKVKGGGLLENMQQDVSFGKDNHPAFVRVLDNVVGGDETGSGARASISLASAFFALACVLFA